MYLVTKLNKRTKTISWFLIHVFVVQLIPFSVLARPENRPVLQRAALTEEADTNGQNIAQSILVLTGKDAFHSKDYDVSEMHESTLNNLKLTAVSSAGGGFSPGSMNDLVDPFTGDFSYSIPLMDVDGYPLVLNYNSNVTMTTEASWVGLGWNLDVGSVDREMRGIPDEFNGTQSVVKTYNRLKDETIGYKDGVYAATVLKKWPLEPKIQATVLWGNYSNTYLGNANTLDIGLQAAISLPVSKGYYLSPRFGIGYSSDTKGGVGFNRDFGISVGRVKGSGSGLQDVSGTLSFGKSTSSRAGVLGSSVSLGWSYMSDGSIKSASFSTSSHITYGTMTSMPRISMSSLSSSKAFNLDAYVGLKNANIIAKVGGMTQNYETRSEVVRSSSNTLIEPAYGYLHSGKRANFEVEEGNNYTFPIMDFNRGTEFEFSEEMKNLPFSIQTYDIFHMKSAGANGSFRPGRTDIGTYYDARSKDELNAGGSLVLNNSFDGVNVGVLIDGTGAGTTVEVGYSTGIQKGGTKYGVWDMPVDFNDVSDGSEYDPSVFFKAVGEPTPNNIAQYELLGGKSANRFHVSKSGQSIISDFSMDFTSNTFTASSLNNLGSKPVIATSFEPLTVSNLMSSTGVINQAFTYYDATGNYLSEQRNSGVKAQNHISAVRVTSTGGAIYDYGIPVYSIKSAESSFSCTGNAVGNSYLPNEGMIIYTTDADSPNNHFGKSHHYDNTEMPAYPTAFLLSTLQSSDYVDITHNGPSIDDVGSYHKFEYTRLYDSSNPYKWRFPVSGYQNHPSSNPRALLNKGFLSLDSDDIGAYTYGEKEVWYPKTIESKNLIAVFELADRKDAFSVIDKDGFIDDSKPLKCLKKISLYNLRDYKANGTNAKALQVVEFDYDYELCPNAPGNKDGYLSGSSTGNGKLTLKRIWTYNGFSQEMGKNSIDFTYSSVNPVYNSFEMDRWGNYKQNDPNKPNDIFPYAIQNPNLANQNATAWKLVKINDASQGEISIDYQADTYGFVQDKRAMRHFEIEGMINLYQYHTIVNSSYWDMQNSSLAPSDEFRKDNFNPDVHIINPDYFKKYGKFEENFVPNNIIVFKLEKALDQSLSRSEAGKRVKDAYFKDLSQGTNVYLKELYFNVMAEVKPGIQEMIPCFAAIAPDYSGLFQNTGYSDKNLTAIGVMPPVNSNSGYEYGYVALDMINVGKIEETKKKEKKDKDILLLHPVQRFAIDFIRKNLPDIVYGACVSCDAELSIDRKALFGNEMYKYIIDQGGYLRSITPEKSMLRLFDPDTNKFGGNARVASITLNDHWSSMTTEDASVNGSYTWSYSYPERDHNKGVASFEPRQGMDESPFYEWTTYFDRAKKFPDELNFHITPIAQQLYPSEVVGYEKVVIKLDQPGTRDKGYVELEFITNKDPKYVTLFHQNLLDKSAEYHARNVLTGSTTDLFGLTQGYSVVTNDFHGKIQRVTLRDSKDQLIQQSEYEYYELGEKVPMIDRKGLVSAENVAQEFDVHLDSRAIHDQNTNKTAGLTLGVTFSVPIKISFSPSFSRNFREKGFYAMNFVKHMNYSAMVKKVTTTKLASENEAQNLLYDKYTGGVVLSSLNDEYNDKLFNLVYPSHWYYPGLREIQAAGSGSISGSMDASNGLLTTTTDIAEAYAPGDLVIVSNGSGSSEGYVLSIAEDGLSAHIVKENGSVLGGFSGSVTMTLKKSNRSNRLTESMQSLVTKEPITIPVPVGEAFTFPSNESVISSSAITYRDKNNLQCTVNGPVNPFANGAKGDLVLDGQFSWQSERKQEQHAHRTRFDGAYATYVPFYTLESSQKWRRLVPATYQNWRKSGEVTAYNQLGNVIEGKDPLRIFSSVLYLNTNWVTGLPVAQAANANISDIAYDGFEAYAYGSGAQSSGIASHFDFVNQLNGSTILISNTERHSGKSAIQIQSGNTAQVNKQLQNQCSGGQYPDTDNPDNLVISADNRCLCTPPFNPQPGEYLCNAWVKRTNANASVQVEIVSGFSPNTTVTSVTCQPVGPVIEGWQRVEGIFIIPPTGASAINVKLQNTSGQSAYFDDLRIHPFLAAMSTTVYDPVTLLPLATHDGNNYTTFYNYDENLQLVRVKVETIEGIKTVSETEFGISTK